MEAFRITILEAACTSMKVVSTNVGGVPEVLPEEYIYLANPNVHDLNQQLCKVVNDC
jgi:phosphatidylinositol N-acetylglucosaminyltransferase subunit A